jgi:hypothetical protein
MAELDDIVEVKEVKNQDEANKLLGDKKWRLLSVKTEKVTRTKAIPCADVDILDGILYTRKGGSRPAINEELETVYVLGRVKGYD